jgi:hypothetical protein
LTVTAGMAPIMVKAVASEDESAEINLLGWKKMRNVLALLYSRHVLRDAGFSCENCNTTGARFFHFLCWFCGSRIILFRTQFTYAHLDVYPASFFLCISSPRTRRDNIYVHLMKEMLVGKLGAAV